MGDVSERTQLDPRQRISRVDRGRQARTSKGLWFLGGLNHAGRLENGGYNDLFVFWLHSVCASFDMKDGTA